MQSKFHCTNAYLKTNKERIMEKIQSKSEYKSDLPKDYRKFDMDTRATTKHKAQSHKKIFVIK
tara:strand:- start:1022 stop:1210 length:189 start_codon:yes stop_codon:yes gene_type:complete